MIQDWENKKESFDVMDVRKLTGNFLPGLLAKAGKLEAGEGICVIQTFEPVPLYSAMADLGFEHLTEKVSEGEYRAYFYRTEKKEASFTGVGDMPLKPTAVLNFKKIDNRLADIIVNFWSLIWGKENPAIDQKTKLLLSLANGVGAGRFRQATREPVKAYALGVTVAELDELFSMFVWNGGVRNFASEIGPSPLFGAYQLIKNLENKGMSRSDVMTELLGKFGETNPEVNVMPQGKGKTA
jgi:alkylhydroperoxidase/carboxymuconolactone decarboxylase family protein YurZ